MRRPRFGLTILELVVATCAIALFFAVIIPAMTCGCGPRGGARSLKDKTQLKQIHQAMLVYAEDNNSLLPLPGRIDPIVLANGDHIENVTLNHSAPLYSSMIAQQLINTAIVIGPTEANPFVIEKRDYDFEAYDPVAGSYWDRLFTARIDAERPGSNTSYAHMALAGKRKDDGWTNTADSLRPMLSTRGPEDGATTGEKYTKSLTLQLQGAEDEWTGNVVFADNHVEYLNTLEPTTIQDCSNTPRNLFKLDGGAMSVSIESTENSATRIWDPLND